MVYQSGFCGRPAQEKAMPITLYMLGLAIRTIARLFAVLKWVTAFAKTHYEKPSPDNAIPVESDEMRH